MTNSLWLRFKQHKEHSETIWTNLIHSNFITFSLNTTQLLPQHIPLPAYTSLPYPLQLPDGFTGTFFKGAAIPRLRSFLTTVEALCSVESSAACRCFLYTNCRQHTLNIWRFNALFPQDSKRSISAHHNRFQFCVSCPRTSITRLSNDAAIFHRHAWLATFSGGMTY